MTTAPADIHTDRALAEKLAQSLANTVQAITYVVEQHGSYMIQDETDISCYWYNPENGTLIAEAQIVATFTPDPPEGPPIVIIEAPDETPPESRTTAVTLISILIDKTTQRNRICPNCQGAHYGWQCPDIHARLFAPEVPWSDPELGHDLWRMRWRRYAAFLTLIQSVPTQHLVIYAASYQAFVRSVNAQSDLQINDILKVWARMIGKSRNGGPSGAAPAMLRAA